MKPLIMHQGPMRAAKLKTAAWLLSAAGLGGAAGAMWTGHASPDAAPRDASTTASASPWSAWQACPSSTASAFDANTPSPSPAATDTPQQRLEQLLHPTPQSTQSGDNPYPALIAQVRQDESFRKDLLARLSHESDPAAMGHLAVLLSSAGTQDVTRTVAGMMASADPAQRQRALLVLSHLQAEDAGSRQAIEGMLQTESDPDTLSRAVSLLSPGSDRTPQEAQALAAQLRQLSQHASPAVRSAALSALARWNTDASTPSVIGGLADPDPGVIAAVIDAMGDAGLRDNAATEALLKVAERQDLPPEVRRQAMDALDTVNLDTTRHARLMLLHRDPSLPG